MLELLALQKIKRMFYNLQVVRRKTSYKPVLSLVSPKYFINSGNRTPKLSAKPRLIALQTADEIHTTQEKMLSL